MSVNKIEDTTPVHDKEEVIKPDDTFVHVEDDNYMNPTVERLLLAHKNGTMTKPGTKPMIKVVAKPKPVVNQPKIMDKGETKKHLQNKVLKLQNSVPEKAHVKTKEIVNNTDHRKEEERRRRKEEERMQSKKEERMQSKKEEEAKRRRKEDERRRRKEEERIQSKEEAKRRHNEEESRMRRKEEESRMRHKEEESRNRRKEDRSKISHTDMMRNNPMEYYRSFNKKPIDFKELYASSDDEKLSSSSDEGESSDDFPSPRTPKKRTTNQEELFNKVKKLERQLAVMEEENRKLRKVCSKR